MNGKDCDLLKREYAADQFVGCHFANIGLTSENAKAFISEVLVPLVEGGAELAIPIASRTAAVESGFNQCK